MLEIKFGVEQLDRERTFIPASEKLFRSSLDTIANRLISMPELKMILLAGPTCSGKTTTAQMLCRALGVRNKTMHQVSIDDFYRNRDDMPERSNYETLDAIDFAYLSSCIREILAGKCVHLPKFDFITGTRTTVTEVVPQDNDLYLFEGIQAIYPEVVNLVPAHERCCIFICPPKRVSFNGEIFDGKDIRLVRRIVRDVRDRGFDAAHTLRVWQTVRENEGKNIFPYEDATDLHIDSFLAYELPVIKPFLEAALATVPTDSEQYDEAQRLRRKFENIPTMSAHYVPADSMFREFIGK